MLIKRLIPFSSRPNLCFRCKTTRPEEWRDPEKFKTVIDPKQRETPMTRYTSEPWMKLKFHNLDPREKKIHSIAINDTLRSDPEEAKNISMEKFESFQRSISQRGSPREQESYTPREDVEKVVESIALQVFSRENQAITSWRDITFESQVLKFKFLQLCARELQHEVPNAELHEMKCAGDVLKFYSQPVEGVAPYQRLLKAHEKGEMPPNLMMLGDPEPFDPESSFMEGIDALPGIYFQPEGLRYRRKYPQLKKKVFWPDI